MKRRIAEYTAVFLLALTLYFFENNTGTRAVLLCAALLPFAPAVRRGLFLKDNAKTAPSAAPENRDESELCREDEPGDIRAYLPGDPVNFIHWKLSAKRDELLVRDYETGIAEASAPKERFTSQKQVLKASGRKNLRIVLLTLAICVLLFTLLLLIPAWNKSLKALSNRIFDLSERTNAYRYEHFAVDAAASLVPSLALLALMAGAVIAATAMTGSRLMAAVIYACCAFFQIYFGIAFPAWLNVILFAAFALFFARRPLEWRNAARIILAVSAIALSVALLLPGVHGATEEASERARDFFSRGQEQITNGATEQPEGIVQIRRAHTQQLKAGEGEAQTGRAFRLETELEQQISMPHWVDYLKIALMLFATIALVILPFLPFALLNARRKKAQAARKAFASSNANEAVQAIFRHVIRWLEAMGYSGGNRPYAEWTRVLPKDSLPEGYLERFVSCAALYEEAAYSEHALDEAARNALLELLNETEQTFKSAAKFRQGFNLRYRECLWV